VTFLCITFPQGPKDIVASKWPDHLEVLKKIIIGIYSMIKPLFNAFTIKTSFDEQGLGFTR